MKSDKVKLSGLLSKKELLIIILFFVIILSVLVYIFFSPNYYKQKSPVSFIIHSGETFASVVDNLYQQDIIPSKNNFKILGIIYGADKKIKAGKYQIPNGLSYVKLLDLLINGFHDIPVLVTIPEGSSINQIAGIFKRDLECDSSKIVELANNNNFIDSLGIKATSLEGYLLPETYYFYSNSSEKDVITKLNNELNNILEIDSIKTQLEKSEYNLHEILTVASIVEGESNLPKEFNIIAGVYYNRLKIGMRLQADPTVQYLVNNRWKRLLNKDLLIDSPYNTYIYAGLPPGPINNPGKAAILASLFPAKHNYLYFVADGKGGHVFSKNYNEHVNAVNKYRKWIQSQRK